MNYLIQKIDQMIEEKSLLKHPFYQTWSDGKLTPEALAGYSKEYYQLVKAVPKFMEPLIKEKHCKLSHYAVAWCLQQSGIASVLIGPKDRDQFEDYLEGLKIEITAEDQAFIDQRIPPGSMVSPFYEADFGPHQYPW